jgi:integrase/recombinase XerD
MPKFIKTITSGMSTDVDEPKHQFQYQANPADLYLISLSSEQSRATMTTVLNQIARLSGYSSYKDAEWHLLDRMTIMAMINAISTPLTSADKQTSIDRRVEELVIDDDAFFVIPKSPATCNLWLSAMKGVARELFIAGRISSRDHDLIKLVKAKRFVRLPKGRDIPKSQLRELLDTCLNDEGVIGIRDAAMMMVLFGCGPRRSELVSIDLADINLVDWSMKVKGKGNKERFLEIPESIRDVLVMWIGERGEQDGPLFVTMDRYDNMYTKPLHHSAVYSMVKKRVRQAGLENISPHDFRRTFITYLLDLDVDIAVVASMAGHSNVDTTRIYSTKQRKLNKKAASLINILGD